MGNSIVKNLEGESEYFCRVKGCQAGAVLPGKPQIGTAGNAAAPKGNGS